MRPLTLLLLPTLAIAQGTAADYERAAKLYWKVKDAVPGQTLEARWGEDGSLVYRRGRESVRVTADGKRGTADKLPPARPPQGKMFQQLSPIRPKSPDGKLVVAARDGNLFLRDGEGEAALTRDGTEKDGYTGEVIWSPDGTKFVAYRVKAGRRRVIHLLESSPGGGIDSKLHAMRYDKPGDDLDVQTPRLFDAKARKEIPLDPKLWPDPWSVGDFRWAADAKSFTFAYNARGHQTLRVIEVEAAAGKSRAVIEETSKTFIDYAHKRLAHHLPGGEVLWMSERSGHNHLYLHDVKEGALKNAITSGEWVVLGVDFVDEKARRVYFRAGGIRPKQSPYHVHHCRVDLDGKDLVVLTEGDGTHSVQWSPDRALFVDTWSRVDHAPVHELRGGDGKLVCVLEKASLDGITKTGWKAPERFVAKGRDGKTDIWGVIYRPTNFDAAKKYPVVEQIYAGPQAAFVPQAFRPFHYPQEVAEFGFVTVQIDGMGTSQRSKAFHDACWKNLADAGLPDRIAWLKAAAKTRPWLDLSRVGVYGGSAGGQSAMRALLSHGDFYKVAVADCGCHDNRVDKVWWNELWMGWPVGPHYAAQSNATDAHKLKGKLMLVVGEMDRNVDPASTLQVVNALVKADKDFDLVFLPGAGHAAAESPYGRRRRADFLVRHLLGIEPRR